MALLRYLLLGSLCILDLGWYLPASAEPLPRGFAFLAADFESPDALTPWSSGATLDVGDQSGHSLSVARPAGAASGSTMVSIPLPIEKMRGYVVQCTVRVKAENVSAKPKPWNGVKFMAPMVSGEGKAWPAAETETGTYDWRKIAFRVAVPDDAREMSLSLGLEAVTGRAWYDDIRVTVWKPLLHPPAPTPITGPVYKGHDLPRLRGAMVSPGIDPESLQLFGQAWHANLIRWQLIRTGPIADASDLRAYDAWLAGAQAKLDAALPWCEKYGLRVVVDLHSPPGGRATQGGYAGSDSGLFTSAACQQKFIDIWRQMARKYKANKMIWGYDLANEPVEPATQDEGLYDWQELAERTAEAIREIDPERTLIIEPAPWGDPSGLRQLAPLKVRNVVYSVHMYQPHAFTHQGVFSKGTTYRYPGEIEGIRWDKARLEKALKPVVDFQNAYHAHVYLGEFSVIRWAPEGSGHRYLADVIDLFESHGWDWSYHAFREWDGWSVEHGSDPVDHNRTAAPTDRQELLCSWYAKNVKPSKADGFVSLFARGDLRGWVEEQHNFYKAKHPATTTWSVKDGITHCDGSTGNCGFLRYEKKLADFTLRLEYCTAKHCNSGVCIRTGVPYNGVPSDSLPSHVGYEVQIFDDAGQSPTNASSGAFYGLLAPQRNAARPAGEWNALEIVCRGPKIRVTLNDQVVQDVDQTTIEAIKDRPRAGYLSLQNHGGDIDFRNVRVKEE